MGSSYSQPAVIPNRWFDAFRATLPAATGKTVVITGTTSGTGFVCARVGGELGATVVLLNRSSARADAALKELQQAVPKATFHQVECDLQSFASVRKAADAVKALCPNGIDVLCNNAGIMAMEDRATGDGYDIQMQTNHLSHFLLTALLYPLLEQRAQAVGDARIVNHSSIARKRPFMELTARYLEKNGGNLGGNGKGLLMNGARWQRYQQTKLANCVFTYALHDKLQARGSKVKSLVAHPGLSATRLQVTSGENGGMSGFTSNLIMSRAGQSQEDGAMGIIKCCFEAADKIKSGEFYGPNQGSALTGPAELIPPEDLLTRAESKTLLWTASEAATGQTFVV